MKLFLLLLVSLQIASVSSAQDVKSHFAALAKGKATEPMRINKETDSQKLLEALKPYLSDTLPAIRSEAYYLMARAGLVSQKKNVRTASVNLLLNGWRDADSGINGQVAGSLYRFNRNDFDAKALNSLRKLSSPVLPYEGKYFKLIGKLGLTDEMTAIQANINRQEPRMATADQWAGYLALARLGQTSALERVMEVAAKAGVNDDVVYELFPDLLYVANPQTVDHVVQAMYIEEERCSSADPESSQSISCAYRIMELLAPVVEGFPIQLTAAGDLAERDYEKALTVVRQWFKEKDGRYTILKDR